MTATPKAASGDATSAGTIGAQAGTARDEVMAKRTMSRSPVTLATVRTALVRLPERTPLALIAPRNRIDPTATSW